MNKLSKIRSVFSSGNRFRTADYDPEHQYPVIRASICTGEKVAGLRDRRDGRFIEIMLIRSPKEEQRFKEMYGVDTLDVEY